MTGSELVGRVQVKLNRIDTNSYQDVRPEEILFYGYNALKSLILGFDMGFYSPLTDVDVIQRYLGSITKNKPEFILSGNAFPLPEEVLKIKDLKVHVKVGVEQGWVPASRLETNSVSTERQGNPFTKSYPDKPTYRFIGNNVKFDIFNNEFEVTKATFDYIEQPIEFELNSTITLPFIPELEDKTVTLILEGLESNRIQSQPLVSKS